MFAVTTLEAFFDQRARKVVDMLIQVIAGMSLVRLTLALIGLYGLMTYSVGLRQREIGIRLAIGAEPVSVLKMVLNHRLVWARKCGVSAVPKSDQVAIVIATRMNRTTPVRMADLASFR